MGIKSALFWFGLVLGLALLWRLFDLPPETEMIAIVSSWLSQYGLWVLLFGSFLESLLFIGLYFPGSLIIFLGVGLAPDPTAAFWSVCAVSVGMAGGYSINYLLGKYGWYRLFLRFGLRRSILQAQANLERHDTRYIFYTFWNPGLAAFSSTAAGIVQMRLYRFVVRAGLAILLWNTFWGVLVYTLGKDALQLLDVRLILFIIGMWVLFECSLLAWRRLKLMQ
ncbi:MAG: hypothetical protein RLZZ360_331 [Candidatus Parcubacteria bacterium]|jgi:membrane protein DedA with SNARE-associated domain